MTKNRVLAAGIGMFAIATALVGCSDEDSAKSSEPAASSAGASSAESATVAAGDAEVSNGGTTEVKVEGQDLAGLDLNSVTCVKQGGKINIGSGAVGGQQGLGVVMTDEATPTVESLGLVVDGSALAVAAMGGASTGSAEVQVDGDTYTITGEATGADMANPMAGMITKAFEIKVTCS